MKKTWLPLFVISFSLLSWCILLSGAQKKIKPEDLPPMHRVWLEEEVVYIITKKERDVFLQLETDRQREMFIEAFWKARDPNLETPENEFKDEHHSRIAYANKYLGRGTPTVGWRTAMGRIYIILGEPNAIERYENYTEVYPTIVWFYQGMAKYGLPQSFNVVFIKKYGSGDYELYSPIRDGPQSLLVHYMGDPKDYYAAYTQLKEVEPQLARASLSLIPDEPLGVTGPTVASEILISNIAVNPQKAIKDAYADKLLKYKDIIEVEYSANYMANDHFSSVIQDRSGIAYVHYLIEPTKLSVGLYDDTYRTTLEISGQVADLSGRTIYQFNKDIPIQFDEDMLQRVQALPFSYQDAFPLVEGNYKFSVLLKNKVSKEFTSLEQDLIVPAFSSSEEMTSMILAPHAKVISSDPASKPFRSGGFQIYPAPRMEFSKNDKLYIFFQIPVIDQDMWEGGRVIYSFYKQDQMVKEREKEIKAYAPRGHFLEEFSLSDLTPAYYRVEVKVMSPENKEVLLQIAYFSVSFVEAIPRPFIVSDFGFTPENPMTDYVVGGQYFNKGEQEKAFQYFERAYRRKPQSLQFAEGFSRVLYHAGRYEEANNILMPFTETEQKDYKFLQLLGNSLQKLKQFVEAITYYKQYLDYYGTNLQVLNAVGICYLELKNFEEALIALEKSVEIDPKQENIKALIARIKEIK
jgi:GWxTD domain-containing protein